MGERPVVNKLVVSNIDMDNCWEHKLDIGHSCCTVGNHIEDKRTAVAVDSIAVVDTTGSHNCSSHHSPGKKEFLKFSEMHLYLKANRQTIIKLNYLNFKIFIS